MHGYKVFRVTDYRSGDGKVTAKIDGREVHLPAPGLHNAANAAAVFAGLSLRGFDPEAVLPAIERFSGVWRRFDFAGRTRGGAAVYDDYAHNVEKICSCIEAAPAAITDFHGVDKKLFNVVAGISRPVRKTVIDIQDNE